MFYNKESNERLNLILETGLFEVDRNIRNPNRSACYVHVIESRGSQSFRFIYYSDESKIVWYRQENPFSAKWRGSSFEEFFESSLPDLQEDLIYHLDLFRSS